MLLRKHASVRVRSIIDILRKKYKLEVVFGNLEKLYGPIFL